MRAYAFCSGHIGFASDSMPVPDGAIVIAHGPRKLIEPIVKGNARLAYDNETYLVPGCPEAENENVALKAFMSFTDRIRAAITKATQP